MKRVDVLYALRNARRMPLKVLLLLTTMALSLIGGGRAVAEQPPAPCHANPLAAQDEATVASRGDIASLPLDLKNQLVRIGGRPHTYLPMQAYAEADTPSQLFQYYLLSTQGF